MSIPTQKETELPLLFEIEAMGGEAKPQALYPRVTAHFPLITDDNLKEKVPTGDNKWRNLIQWARQKLVVNGDIDKSARGLWRITEKGRSRLANSKVQSPNSYPFVYEKGRVARTGTQPPEGQTQLPPPIRQHEELKQKMVEIGKQLGYYTETEQGPQYRHDVLWKEGVYRTPSHVIEICEHGSLPKDFDVLHWASDSKNWGAAGILVVADDKDYTKAINRFAGHSRIAVVKAETVEQLHAMIQDNLQFLRLIFCKGD